MPIGRFVITVLALSVASYVSITASHAVELSSLRGIVVDDEAAEYTGQWLQSSKLRPFVSKGYHHDENTGQGTKSARFTLNIPADGEYHVLLGYKASGNRASNVPVAIKAANGTQTVHVNQQKTPKFIGFHDLGIFKFQADQDAVIVVSNDKADGYVIVDAVQIVTAAEFKLVQEDAAKKPTKVAKKKTKEKPIPLEPMPIFQREKAESLTQLTVQQLDAMLAKQLGDNNPRGIVGGETFLRRVTLDLAGRQPTVRELEAFNANESSAKRTEVIERLLSSNDYGQNWANYWSDVIGYRQQQPQLTFHNYRPFKKWLGDQLNTNQQWDQIVFSMLTSRGMVGEHPEGTFIAFHQANPNKLAGETGRVFLGVKVHCAECHDHPFIDMPTETFHGMAAFFARTEAKIPHNDSSLIELTSKADGEHKVPGKKEDMQPVALLGIPGEATYELGIPDLRRRATLAQWMVHPQNPFFARAYVNRIWDRMMGRGFFNPVDDLGELAEDPILADIHQALAEHFVASGYDHKSVVRLIANLQAYQRPIEDKSSQPVTTDIQPFALATTKKLRGDEVFDSLVTAIQLPNIAPETAKPTDAIRFPVPPMSTRELVNAAFGYDPSFRDDLLVRSMKQAMFMMNNTQLQKQINSAPESDTYLAKLLMTETDDQAVVTNLYRAVLARSPTDKELAIVFTHLKQVGERGAAFEDTLWSLINSAEFTTRR